MFGGFGFNIIKIFIEKFKTYAQLFKMLKGMGIAQVPMPKGKFPLFRKLKKEKINKEKINKE